MNTTPLDPEMAYHVKIAAAYYNMSPSAFVRHAIQRRLDELADSNSVIRATFAMKR